METYSIIVYLRKIIPDIDLLDDNIQNIIQSDIDYESKVIKILSKYFKEKKEKYLYPSYNEILVEEAKELEKLFPSKSFQYLLYQLEIFKDLPNRKEIVTRQIVFSKCPNNVPNGMTSISGKHCGKRVSEIFDNINNNNQNPKVRRVDTTPNCSNITLEPPMKSSVSSTVTQELKPPTKTQNVANAVRVIRPPKKIANSFHPKAPVSSTITSSSTPHTTSQFNPLDYRTFPKPATVTSTITSLKQDPVLGIMDNITNSKAELGNSALLSDLFYEIPDVTEYVDHTPSLTNFQSAPDYLDTQNTKLDFANDLVVGRNCAVGFSDDSSSLEKPVDLKTTASAGAVNSDYNEGFSDTFSLKKSEDVKLKATPNNADNSSGFSDESKRGFDNIQNVPKLELPNAISEQIVHDVPKHLNENNVSSDPSVEPARKGIIRSISDTGIVNTEAPRTKCIRVRRLSELNRERHIFNCQKEASVSLVELSETESTETDSRSTSSSSGEEYSEKSMEIMSTDAESTSESGKSKSNDGIKLRAPTLFRISENILPKDKVVQPYLNNLQEIDNSNGANENAFQTLAMNNEPVQNMTSTSSSSNESNQNTVATEFSLVDYVQEITTASSKIIKKHCERLNLSLKQKPSPEILSLLIDNIFAQEHGSVIKEEVRRSDLGESSESVNNTMSNKPLVTAKTEINEINSDTVSEDGNIDVQLVNKLCTIFPDACPKYVKGLCKGKVMSNEVFDDLITVILDTNNTYPKRSQRPPEPEIVPENQLEILQEFLPDADPDYLRMMCDKFEGNPELVKSFLNEAMEKKNYPTMKEYQRRQQLSAQQKQYTSEFTVENFIKVIPDPHAFFSDPSRNIKLDAASTHYALVFLRNKFNRLPVRVIQSAYTKNNTKLSDTIKELKRASTQSQLLMKSVRKPIDMPKNIENIPLAQEIAYYLHENEIKEYLKTMKDKEEAERKEAKDKGLMKTCNCCYDEEVLLKNIFSCENGCEFCKLCIVKSAEIRFGEGKLDFPCLMHCKAYFSLQTLQTVLSPKLFSKIAQKKTLEEVKSAGIEELEFCPFCDFATIPAEGYNIFACMNPECMKESCRMCKEPSHIPLRCDEVEKDEDVRARTFVENKMTEALLRKCWKCGVKFFKEEGCNKMTCSCGAQMCYVCGKPVTGYQHFNGNGGDRYDLCPLYSDSNVLNKQNVLKGAEQAKAAIGNVNLKHDPTADVDKYYKERSKKNPQDHLLEGQQPPVVPVQRQVVPVQRQVEPVQRQVVPAQRQVEPAQRQVLPAQRQVVPAQRQVEPAQRQVEPAQRQVLPAQRQVVPAQRQVEPAQRQVVPAQRQVEPAQRQVLPAQRQVLPAQRQVVPEQRQVVPEQRQVVQAQVEVQVGGVYLRRQGVLIRIDPHRR